MTVAYKFPMFIIHFPGILEGKADVKIYTKIVKKTTWVKMLCIFIYNSENERKSVAPFQNCGYVIFLYNFKAEMMSKNFT